MQSLIQDLRFGIRTLGKNPAFAAIAILTLALGIGANTAIFSVVNSVLLAPLAYPDASRLVSVYQRTEGGSYNVFSAPNYLAWKDHAQAFERMAVWTSKSYSLASASGPELVTGAPVTANIFPLLGVPPLLGRPILAQEDVPGGAKVAVLSYGFWQAHFGGLPGAIGRSLTLDGDGYTIVGVMPAGFEIPQNNAALWVPLQLNPNDPNSSARGLHWLFGIARLKPGATLAGTEAEIGTLAPRVGQQYPRTDAGYGLLLVPLIEDIVGQVRPVLQVLLAAVGLVLLIACVNVANLLLARASSRQKEFALRAAIGAGRGRLLRQLLTESSVLALVGGVFGLLLAFGAVHLLGALAPAGSVPRMEGIAVNGRALAFTLLVTLVTGVAFGVIPALHASKIDLNEVLKESSGAAGVSRGRIRLRSLLVVSEVAIALMLLIGAGLAVASFIRLHEVNLGFDPQRVLSLRISLPAAKLTGEQLAAFRRSLVENTAALPGVQSVALTRNLPLSGTDPSLFFTIQGAPPVGPGHEPIARARFVSPGFFHTLGIPLRKGRDFSEGDDASAPGTVIISETMARQYWPNEDPLGKQITPGYPQGARISTIVGVVGDVRHWLAVEEPPVAYYPYAQIPSSFVPILESYVTLTLRTARNPASLLAPVRAEIRRLDADAPVYQVETMDQLVHDAAAANRFQMLLLAAFALAGLLLAAVGIYGVLSYSVAQRTREIGIRMALGAERASVTKLIVKQAMILAGAGIGLGLFGALGLAWGLTRFLSALLYSVKPADPPTFVLVSVLLAAVALLASYLPARRATRVDPVVALRHD